MVVLIKTSARIVNVFTESEKSCMSKKNINLRTAAKNKKDEWYTPFKDIEAEVYRYKDQLRDKVIYCPCDWDESFERIVCYENGTTNEAVVDKIKSTKCNFIKFLVSQASDFGIKKIIASGYNPTTKQGIRFQDADYSGVDIVITNPPYSQFKEFIPTMFNHNLKFLVVGPLNAITYKENFLLLKENKMWLGYANSFSGFIKPDGSIEKKGNDVWYTNLDVSYRHDWMILTEEYNAENYQKYDNFEAIEVGKQKLIPENYDGLMGVPISFLLKYNPDQFEIVDGLNRYAVLDTQNTNSKVRKERSHSCNINGKTKFFRIVIKRRTQNVNES